MVPRLAVFASRARQADLVSLKGDLPGLDDLEASVRGHLTKNSAGDSTYLQKLTLAIGGGGGDEL